MRLGLSLGACVLAGAVGCGGLLAPLPSDDDSDAGRATTPDAGHGGPYDASVPPFDAYVPPTPVLDASVPPPPPYDAWAPYDAWTPYDARPPSDVWAPPDVVSPPPTGRMSLHGGRVLPSMRLVAVYFGDANVNGSASWDAFMTWLVKSAYWGTMKQYGVGPGTFVASVRMDPSVLHPSGDAGPNLIDATELGATIEQLLHPGSTGFDDASTTSPTIPVGDGYIFFMPDGLQITFDDGTGTPFQSCIDFGGYHDVTPSHDPYSIIPPCAFGRSGLAISHELAEMVTDPDAGDGWFSDADIDNGGGEIGDLCNNPTTVEGWSVTQLWSNSDATCVPF